MDKMHDYPSELPGGLAYQKPKPIPDDLYLTTELHLGSGTALPAPAPAQPAAVSASWRFPITMECSVLSADLQAYLSGSAAAFAGSDLTLTLSDPQGTELQTMHLGRTGSGTSDASSTWNATQKQTSSTTFALPTGNYTLSLTGTSMDATVHVAAHVDYYASYDEMKISHHLHKTPLCGRYGNGNDVGESQPPGSI